MVDLNKTIPQLISKQVKNRLEEIYRPLPFTHFTLSPWARCSYCLQTYYNGDYHFIYLRYLPGTFRTFRISGEIINEYDIADPAFPENMFCDIQKIIAEFVKHPNISLNRSSIS